MAEVKDLDRYEELVQAIIPIFDEMEQLKKIVGEKTFQEITKKLEDEKI